MSPQHLDHGLVLVLRGDVERLPALSVGLRHAATRLEQILYQLLAPITSRVVKRRVAVGVDREWIGPAVQQQLDDGDTVSADGVAQRGNAPRVLGVQWPLLLNVLLDCLEVAHLGRLVQREGRLVDLLQRGLELLRHPAHGLAELEHQLLVLVVLHDCLHPVLLDVLDDGGELRVLLQRPHAALHLIVGAPQLPLVVVRHGLRLQPASHRLGVLREGLQFLGHVWVALQVIHHLAPGGIVNARHLGDADLGAVAQAEHIWGGDGGSHRGGQGPLEQGEALRNGGQGSI
mmetsp:Transcript_44742/g.116369  ORF Transcript_44742/g.116369 Transcript_44742/m.116369 type:complete len:288 (-) Transcript_44742:15-878(-)